MAVFLFGQGQQVVNQHEGSDLTAPQALFLRRIPDTHILAGGVRHSSSNSRILAVQTIASGALKRGLDAVAVNLKNN